MADAFIKGAAARGMTGLARDLGELSAAGGHPRQRTGDRRPGAGRRLRPVPAADVVVHPGRRRTALLDPTRSGEALIVELPIVPVRSLSDYAMGEKS